MFMLILYHYTITTYNDHTRYSISSAWFLDISISTCLYSSKNSVVVWNYLSLLSKMALEHSSWTLPSLIFEFLNAWAGFIACCISFKPAINIYVFIVCCDLVTKPCYWPLWGYYLKLILTIELENYTLPNWNGTWVISFTLWNL